MPRIRQINRVVAACLLATALVSQAGIAQHQRLSGRDAALVDLKTTIMGTQALVPATGFSGLFTKFLLHDLTNGGRMLEMGTRLTDRNASRRIFFKVDTIAGTYEAVALPAMPFDDYAALFGYEEAPHHGDRSLDPAREMPPSQRCSCPDQCSGSWTAHLETLEPALETVAKTTAFGAWSRQENFDDTGCWWMGHGGGTCWANPHVNLPPPFDTHWFKDACLKTGPYTSDGDFYVRERGWYHNDDFGLPNLRTYAYHSVVVELISGFGVDVDYIYADSGEFSWLIFGWTSSSGSNSCF